MKTTDFGAPKFIDAHKIFWAGFHLPFKWKVTACIKEDLNFGLMGLNNRYSLELAIE